MEDNNKDNQITINLKKERDLRYGENPHQKASLYSSNFNKEGLNNLKQLNGKELSYNNLLDINCAINFIKDFKEPASVIIKHGNPTGLSINDSLEIAYNNALECDRLSAFGGIIGFNKKVDEKVAQRIIESGFMECIVAPEFEEKGSKYFKSKKEFTCYTSKF